VCDRAPHAPDDVKQRRLRHLCRRDRSELQSASSSFLAVPLRVHRARQPCRSSPSSCPRQHEDVANSTKRMVSMRTINNCIVIRCEHPHSILSLLSVPRNRSTKWTTPLAKSLCTLVECSCRTPACTTPHGKTQAQSPVWFEHARFRT
jgi:hypothetical protein